MIEARKMVGFGLAVAGLGVGLTGCGSEGASSDSPAPTLHPQSVEEDRTVRIGFERIDGTTVTLELICTNGILYATASDGTLDTEEPSPICDDNRISPAEVDQLLHG